MAERKGDDLTVWPTRRLAAPVLTLLLAALAVYTWRAGVGDPRTRLLLCAGVVLGLFYTGWGHSLPPLVHRLGGGRVTADDDPRNLPPKVYLPVLLAVVVLAVVAYVVYAPRR